jgi:uncharacterized membrane protein YbhN (UPF0104 family)
MRRVALIAVKFAVSALLLYFATRRINFDMIGERLNRLDMSWLAAAIAIALVQTGLGAIRWQRIALLCGAPLQMLQAVRFNMVAAFFNQVLPSTIGGDAARVILLARAGAGWWKAAYSVLLDRFIGVLALAAVVTAGLYWSFGLIQNTAGRLVLVVIGVGSLAAGAAFLALSALPWFARWDLTRRLAELSGLARQIFSHRSSVPIVLLSLIIHLMTATIAWSIAHAVAAGLGYADALLLVLPVMLIATIPISIAGWGVRESALVLAFSYAGLPASDGLIIAVLLGGVMFVVGVIGGAVWLISREKSLRMADAVTAEQPRS